MKSKTEVLEPVITHGLLRLLYFEKLKCCFTARHAEKDCPNIGNPDHIKLWSLHDDFHACENMLKRIALTIALTRQVHIPRASTRVLDLHERLTYYSENWIDDTVRYEEYIGQLVNSVFDCGLTKDRVSYTNLIESGMVPEKIATLLVVLHNANKASRDRRREFFHQAKVYSDKRLSDLRSYQSAHNMLLGAKETGIAKELDIEDIDNLIMIRGAIVLGDAREIRRANVEMMTKSYESIVEFHKRLYDEIEKLKVVQSLMK